MTIRTLFLDGSYSHADWPLTGGILRELLRASPFVPRNAHLRARAHELLPRFTGLRAHRTSYSPIPDDKGNPLWPPATQAAFEKAVAAGCGQLIVHATSNAFARWPAYNEMIGLGGWGGRGEEAGVYVYVDDRDNVVRSQEPGEAGHHEPEHEYLVEARRPNHPVLEGLPSHWLHCQDEAYSRLRGPAQQLEVLATVFAGKTAEGSQRHEPAVMRVRFGQGRGLDFPTAERTRRRFPA